MTVGLIQAMLLLSRPAAAVDVPTIYDYAAPIPLGGQAAGMAGAYTALGCREAALHFNPAALACANGSRLELSANSYILDSLSVPDPFGSNADFRSLTFTALPSAVGATRLLRKGNAHGTGALGLGVTIELPRSIYIRADPADLKKAKFLSANVRDSLATADVGIGYQLSRYVAFGASLGVGLRLFDHQYQAFQAGYGGADCPANAACSEMLQYSARDEGFAVGAHAKVGVRFTPNKRWSVGTQLAFPTVNIAGRNALSIVQASGWSEDGDTGYDAVVFRDVGKSDLSLPFRVSAGVAWQGERVTVSGDLGVAFPRQVAFAYDVQQSTVDATGSYSEE